ncbi:MAG TPA: twin-arginine translocation signal domain-containing protein, partial [Candidatus Methylomirabilis sp.]|nr:twin-arginine translocation signal domain-containing protein [Candidatus Methylomirabilis sp.]
MDLSRRSFVKLGTATGAWLAGRALLAEMGQAEAGTSSSATLTECMALSPEEMAKRSPFVTGAWEYLKQQAATISAPDLRSVVLAALENPAPTFLKRLSAPGVQAAAYQELTAKNLLKDRSQSEFLPERGDPASSLHPFWAAPG